MDRWSFGNKFLGSKGTQEGVWINHGKRVLSVSTIKV